jgi:hypothetical protein
MDSTSKKERIIKFLENLENKKIIKTKYSITIEIECESESGFENSIDEAVKNIKNGCTFGQDSSDEESYVFEVKKERISEIKKFVK